MKIKWTSGIVCLLLLMMGVVCAEGFREDGSIGNLNPKGALLPQIECPKRYSLFAATDGNGNFEGYCRICNETITVLPSSEKAVTIGTADKATCVHQYRVYREPKAVVWENATWPVSYHGWHSPNTWYEMVCDLCGDKAEACIMGTERYRHENIEITDIHMEKQGQHLFIYRCSVCGQYSYDMIPCGKIDDNPQTICETERNKYKQ